MIYVAIYDFSIFALHDLMASFMKLMAKNKNTIPMAVRKIGITFIILGIGRTKCCSAKKSGDPKIVFETGSDMDEFCGELLHLLLIHHVT